MRKLYNKGQITIFILLGLIILIGFGLVLYLKSGKAKEVEIKKISELPLSLAPIKNYIDLCIEEVAVPGIYLLANKGGYIYDYEKVLLTENVQPAYHLEFDNETSPTKGFMENELSKFISDSLKLCINDFQDFKSYEFEYGKSDVKVNIEKEKVTVNINYPITIIKGNAKTTISEFRNSFPIRLGHVLDVKNKVLKNIKGNDFIDLDFLSLHDVEINILPYDKENIIYSIFDNKSDIKNAPFIFNFAVKSIGNSAPELDFVPDFVLTKNKLFTYDLNATDANNDDLFYYAENSSVKINSTSGIFTFLPTNEGLYEIKVCVRDKYLAKDCDDIKFMVENE